MNGHVHVNRTCKPTTVLDHSKDSYLKFSSKKLSMKKNLSKCTALCKNHIENAQIIISNKGKGNMANIMYYDNVTVPNDYCYIYHQQQLEGKGGKNKKKVH